MQNFSFSFEYIGRKKRKLIAHCKIKKKFCVSLSLFLLLLNSWNVFISNKSTKSIQIDESNFMQIIVSLWFDIYFQNNLYETWKTCRHFVVQPNFLPSTETITNSPRERALKKETTDLVKSINKQTNHAVIVGFYLVPQCLQCSTCICCAGQFVNEYG